MSVRDVGQADWDKAVSRADTLTLVDFWAPWCPWCRKLAPELEALAPQFAGKIVFLKVNADESPEITSKYGVMGLPTIKFFCSGRVVGELVGYMPRNLLKAELERYLGRYKECLAQLSTAQVLTDRGKRRKHSNSNLVGSQGSLHRLA